MKGSEAADDGWAAIDLLLTMAFPRQPVAAHGNGFGLFPPFSRPDHLPPVATDCDRWALSEEGLLVKSSAG
jgi:hypothetical protein